MEDDQNQDAPQVDWHAIAAAGVDRMTQLASALRAEAKGDDATHPPVVSETKSAHRPDAAENISEISKNSK
ncbi:hypothetical protein [Candidatus Marimicrobium litorale]|uniref:Uncharacterized protein n=1 Tax=Candidatus Marimicrobium litorale TaxID=2518991 RepID=A0ABT3T2H4_9GAMM|nr:hypothetical protein [Candidatus Marimicrobium litorale]MCX2976365.1 hypothetical protein [Candidatus Marimicrobium litorale]